MVQHYLGLQKHKFSKDSTLTLTSISMDREFEKLNMVFQALRRVELDGKRLTADNASKLSGMVCKRFAPQVIVDSSDEVDEINV